MKVRFTINLQIDPNILHIWFTFHLDLKSELDVELGNALEESGGLREGYTRFVAFVGQYLQW